MSLAAHAAALLGSSVAGSERLAGGDLSEVLQVRLATGREIVAKRSPDPCAEAHMLRALVAAGVPAPAVLAVDAEVLLLEALPAAGSVRDAWNDLGGTLATLHHARHDRYGWERDYAFGSVAILNRWCDDWPLFWAEHRLLNNVPHVPRALGRRTERLAAELPSRLPARPPAALLHGDLWGGNILVEGSRVSGLIDPACYYGDAEVDLAMLALFDRPTSAFYASYGTLWPDHVERQPVYQLWPALVHLRLFGGGYAGLVGRLLDAAGIGASG